MTSFRTLEASPAEGFAARLARNTEDVQCGCWPPRRSPRSASVQSRIVTASGDTRRFRTNVLARREK
ncbi:hypothetical protein [Actinopolyspora mzabensis]|uniref:hypothetical protein n=1 Tax=Actinopolyspora mzabensis TaxID=995066 RepID=UPI001C40986B|nr:hypothetical protein [Actinopolyspora mzabensis]